MKLVIATKNKNKISEIRDIMRTISGLEILSIADFGDIPDVVEDGTTFRENAQKKAAATAKYTGLAALSDDSGLMIDALHGEPGVFSARYGGAGLTDIDRNLLVLKKMENIPNDKRTARFICVIAIAMPNGTIHYAEGNCEGLIIHEQRGTEGFGYDPIFFLPYKNKTMAELTLAEKNTISHRARALVKASEILATIGA